MERRAGRSMGSTVGADVGYVWFYVVLGAGDGFAWLGATLGDGVSYDRVNRGEHRTGGTLETTGVGVTLGTAGAGFWGM